MSAYLESTSAVLGEYMLKGWTMTDLVCHHCRTTPLMREPAAQATAAGRSDAQRIQFCGRCDGSPDGASSSSAAISTPTSAPAAIPAASVPGAADASGLSAADRAANEISSLLLQGYSLLGTNCPSPSCQGIPLVGYPKSKDGKRDPRKRCVGCGQGYVDEKDAASIGASSSSTPVEDAVSPRSKRRRELYAEGERVNRAVAEAAKAAAVPVPAVFMQAPVSATTPGDDVDMAEDEAPSVSLRTEAISRAEASLSRSLIKISESLDGYADRLDGHWEIGNVFINVKLHTEAMTDICNVLKTLQNSK